MRSNDIINQYFEWLYRFICGNDEHEVSYRKLFMRLHDLEFVYYLPHDENRASDGINLRYRFSLAYGLEDEHDWNYRSAISPTIFDGPCSMLELLISVAIRCEEIANDPEIGDRTSQWFWGMIVNLGLGAMYDDVFDAYTVDQAVDIFIRREYDSNGEGGLFKLRHCRDDARNMEIWRQMCWYLNEVT